MKPSFSHLLSFVAIAIWSTLEVSGKLLDASVSPYAITSWRFLIGGLVLLPFALSHRGSRLIGFKGLLHLLLLGLVNVCFSMLILQLSIHLGKASLSAVIVSMNPLFVALFSWLILKERMSLGYIIGLALGLFGIAILVMGEVELNTVRYRNLPLGIVLAIIASLGFGFYTVLTKKAVMRYGNLITNSVSFISGAVLLFIFNLIAGFPSSFQPTVSNLLLIGYLGIILTGLAYLLYFEGMKTIGATSAAMYFFLKPLISTFLAWILLKETLAAWQIIAVILIVLAMNLPRIYKWIGMGDGGEKRG